VPRRPLVRTISRSGSSPADHGEADESTALDAMRAAEVPLGETTEAQGKRAATPQQRHAMEEMLSHGMGYTEVCELMVSGAYVIKEGRPVGQPMAPATVRRTIARIRKRWAEQDEEHKHEYRLAQMRRLYTEIGEARRAKNYGAVAALERLLADVQGTREPERVAVDVRATLRNAVEVTLDGMTPQRMAELATAYRERRKARLLGEAIEAEYSVAE
jgi:hypothetical protein